MAIGINVSNETRVEIGEIKEVMLADLQKSNIDYDVVFDKVTKNGIKETIVYIPEVHMEVSIENDIVTYIKSGNNPFTTIDKIDAIKSNIGEHLTSIKKKLFEMFPGYDIKIEKIDVESMNITVILKLDLEKIRMHVMRASNGEIFINTMVNID